MFRFGYLTSQVAVVVLSSHDVAIVPLLLGYVFMDHVVKLFLVQVRLCSVRPGYDAHVLTTVVGHLHYLQ